MHRISEKMNHLKEHHNDFFELTRQNEIYTLQKHQRQFFSRILERYNELRRNLQHDYNQKFNIVDCLCGTGKSVIELYVIYSFHNIIFFII